jgi:hypothetical protein
VAWNLIPMARTAKGGTGRGGARRRRRGGGGGGGGGGAGTAPTRRMGPTPTTPSARRRRTSAGASDVGSIGGAATATSLTTRASPAANPRRREVNPIQLSISSEFALPFKHWGTWKLNLEVSLVSVTARGTGKRRGDDEEEIGGEGLRSSEVVRREMGLEWMLKPASSSRAEDNRAYKIDDEEKADAANEQVM